MVRKLIEAVPDPLVQFAFEHVDAMAGMLRRAGHIDMALLLDGIGDVYALALRRAAETGVSALIQTDGDVVGYAAAQMHDLAEMMARLGIDDAAVLFNLPAQLLALLGG